MDEIETRPVWDPERREWVRWADMDADDVERLLGKRVLADPDHAVKPAKKKKRETRRPRAVAVRMSWWDLTVIAWRQFMTAFLFLLIATPVWVIASGTDDQTMGWTIITTVIAMILLPGAYAPWYAVAGFVPFWVLYAVVTQLLLGGHFTGGEPWIGNGGEPGHRWILFWIWLFCVYPFVRGIWHQQAWIRERKAGIPRHRTTKHPWALAATAAGMAAMTHYLVRGKKKG